MRVEGQPFQHIALPGEGWTDEIGRPALPALGRWVALPPGTDATVQVMDAQFTLLEGYRVYPVQESVPDQDTAGIGFTVDRDFYQGDAFYPQALALLEPL